MASGTAEAYMHGLYRHGFLIAPVLVEQVIAELTKRCRRSTEGASSPANLAQLSSSPSGCEV